MIYLEHFLDSPPESWDRELCRLGGSIFHSSGWARYKQASRGVEAIFLCGRDDSGEIRAGALALLSRPERRLVSIMDTGLRILAHPYVDEGHPQAGAEFLVKCEEYARIIGCRQLDLGSSMSSDSSLIPALWGYSETQRHEFEADLTLEIDTLWKAVQRDHRERIKRLPRQGVEIDCIPSRDALAALEVARAATQQRRAKRGQSYGLEREEFYATLYEHLIDPGLGRLFVARQSGEVVAAILFVVFNGRALSVFSGSTEQGYKLGAQSGLYWAAVEAFRSEGLHLLNRGGVPASAADPENPLHGIYRFKYRLGTTPRLCRSGTKIVSPSRDQLYRLGRGVRRVFERSSSSVATS